MGWKLNALMFLFAVWALNLGALVVGVPILLVLFYRYWANRQSRPRIGRSYWMIYLGVFLLMLSFSAAAERGTRSPVVFGAAGVALLCLALFPGLAQGMVERVVGPASEFFGAMSGNEGGSLDQVTCVELTSLPLNYLDSKRNDPKETLLKFQRLVQTLAELGSVVELRLEFSEGLGRIMFRVPGKDTKNLARGLLRVVKSQLPEFGAEITELSMADNPFSVSIEGVPETAVDPIGPLAKFFVENHLDGAYGVSVCPASVNPVSRWLAGRRQRKLAEGSGFQHVDDDRTTTVVDHPKQVELEESVKGLERLLARRPIRVSVQVSAKDESAASHAASVLAGALSSHRRINGLKVGRPRATRRSGWHGSTLMLPSEAAPYFWIPQTSLGMKVAPSAEFQTPPEAKGEVALGEAVSLSGKSGHQVRIGRDQLTKHIFVTGMTGSGKTTSCFGLLLQLAGMGIPFLVIEPVKSEYRNLLACIPDLQVFTIGDEATAPFRLNIFEPPPGVRVQAHLENLVAVWNASFVSYAPLPYIVPQVFADTYRACGWDLAEDKRGRAIAFEDVLVQLERVVDDLGYERDVTMDIEAALKTRLRSLTFGGKGPLFGAVSSTPLEAVMKRPTVIELKDIQNDEEKAFVAALLLTNLASWVQAKGQSRHLRHFTMIEEAHRLLPNVSVEKGDPERADPRRRMVEQFGEMLAELRAYGEGLAVVEQIPAKILPDAIKNTVTKVIHRVPAEDDRAVLAGAVNATPEQSAVFGALMPGEAVLSLESHPVPVRVEVENVVSKLHVPLGEVSSAEVRERMAGFYMVNPLPREAPRTGDRRLRRLVESKEFGVSFRRAYDLWLRQGRVEPLAVLLGSAAKALTGDEKDIGLWAYKILKLAVARHLALDERDRELFPRLFIRAVERSLGDARGLR